MYIEHPYFYEGKYYANIDGEMIEVTKEVAYAMNNFYRSSKAKKVEIKNELGEVVDKMLREVPYSGQSIDGEVFMIEDFPDLKGKNQADEIIIPYIKFIMSIGTTNMLRNYILFLHLV